MAIFHFSAKTVSRGDGRSSTAAAAYRAGEKIVDERTGEIHDYLRKRGVVCGSVVLPGGNTLTRSELWNKVEAKHKRGDAIVAREFELALPAELTDAERIDLVSRYAGELSDKYGVAVDWNIHAPADGELNHHTHVMLSACYVTAEGVMGKKCVELDPIHCKRAGIPNAMESQRARWQDLCNAALERAGSAERIDHRSNEARGLTEIPGHHHGPAVSGLLGRGEPSDVAERMDAERATRERAQLEAQLAIARAQSDAAQSELQALESQELAQEALAVARLAQVQEDERERAKRLLMAAQDQERERAKRVQSERVALAQARSAYELAEQVLERAELAEQEAGSRVEELKNDRDWAILGQQEAGQSMLKTAQALLKLPSWTRAINAYETAVQVLSAAVRAVNAARQKVAQAWQKVLGLDPVERAKLAAKVAAMAEKLTVVPVPVRQQAAPVPVVHHHQDGHDGDADGGRHEPAPDPAPGA